MSARKLNVLIGGGRGFIGTHLVNLLKVRGHAVTILSRTEGQGRVTWDDIDKKGLPEGCNAVINVSGELLMNPMRRFDDSFKRDLSDSRLGTNKRLIRAITQSKNPPGVFLSSSAVGYYEPSPDDRYTEDSPSTGDDFMSQLCRGWESSAQLPQNVQTRQALIRIGLVLGRDGGVIQNLITPFFLGLGGPTGSGKQWCPWVHADDVAGVFTYALENDHVSGPMNAVAPGIVTNGEFASAFGRAMWRPAIIPLPGFVVNTIFGTERGRVMLEGQHVTPKRTEELGYEFMYPNISEACKEFAHFLP